MKNTSCSRRAPASFCTSDVKSCVPLMTLDRAAREAWMDWTSLMPLYRSRRRNDSDGDCVPVLSDGIAIFICIRLVPCANVHVYKGQIYVWNREMNNERKKKKKNNIIWNFWLNITKKKGNSKSCCIHLTVSSTGWGYTATSIWYHPSGHHSR